MKAITDQLLYRCAELETALRDLLARADDHWKDKGCAWKEQEHARAVLAGIPRLDTDAAKYTNGGPMDIPFGE